MIYMREKSREKSWSNAGVRLLDGRSCMGVGAEDSRKMGCCLDIMGYPLERKSWLGV